MPLTASRRRATRASCPWVSLALIAAMGIVVCARLAPGVRAGGSDAQRCIGSALAVDEMRTVLGAQDAARTVESAQEPASAHETSTDEVEHIAAQTPRVADSKPLERATPSALPDAGSVSLTTE